MIYDLQQEFRNAMQEEEHQTSLLSMPNQLASKISQLLVLMRTKNRVAFQLDSSSREDFVEAVEVRFFVLPKTAQPKFKKLYTAVVNHVDLLKNETLRSSVFLSPNSLARIYGKGKKANPRDLAVAVEIHAGQIIGGEVTEGKTSKWWQKSDVPTDSSMLRPKSKTPFAYLWFDSYAETRD